MTWKERSLFIMVFSLLILGAISHGGAFISREYTLDEVVCTCSNVMFGKVASFDQQRMCFVVDQIENAKGEGQFEQIKINMALGQGDSTKQLMGKLSTGVPVVIFYVPMGERRLEALGYVSNMWIRLFGIHDGSETFKWHFAYIERYMGRTFDGDTSRLQSLVRDILSEEKRQGSTNIDVFVYPEYTLDKVVRACSGVMFGKVTSIDQEKMRFAVDQVENIKGKEQFRQIKVNLALGPGDSAKQIMSKLSLYGRTSSHTPGESGGVPQHGVPIVLFYAPVAGNRVEALGYVADIWIRLFAVHDGSEVLEWYFVRVEENMESVYSGDALRLQSLVRDMVAEKKTARLKTK